jgi:hypothetical protein
MQTTDTAERPPAVSQPEHKLSQLTTYELRDYRRELERAITFYEKRHPTAPVLTDLRAKLGQVQEEEDSRRKIADA